MEFFAHDDRVVQLESDLAMAQGSARLDIILALSWQLRQRASGRALALVDEAETLLAFVAGDQQLALTARLRLIQAEVKIWIGEIGAAEQLIQAALQGLAHVQDPLGCADAHWLLAGVAIAYDDKVRQEHALRAMATAATGADPVRLTVAQVGLAFLSMQDEVARQQWAARFAAEKKPLHPAATCWVEQFLGHMALAMGEYGQAFKHLSCAYTLALVSGQIRFAAYFASNIGQALSNLNEHQSALEWIQRLLDLAREYAKLGEHQQAYQYALQASAARAGIHSREVVNRAIAIQVNHQTEQARIEAEHHRQLAVSEAQRASVLQQTSDTLQHLSAIGQEITAHLDSKRVFEVLERHAHHLLEVDILAIYLMNAKGDTLQLAFCDAATRHSAPLHIALDDPHSNAARCMRELREILLDQDPAQSDSCWMLPGPPTLSRLFAPLCVADKVLGVITVQSFRRHRYGSHEQRIFQTLCAYAEIALSNAQVHEELTQAHAHLQKTHQQMIQQTKMAGLGALTVGVANEINNPVNFAHVAVQNLRVDLQDFEAFLADLVQAEEASDMLAIFAQHFAGLHAHIATMLNGTNRIKGIVQDLHAFGRASESEKKTVRLSQCLNSTLNLVRSSWLEKVEFSTEFDDDPELECWPALLNQVFMNLLVNGCQAIEEKRQQSQTKARGKMCLRLKLNPHQNAIEVAFEDSGVGIGAQAQTRVMEPFYTTKAVGSGTGLGLSIAYEIVQKHGGSLHLESSLGVGSCFTISLPLMPNKLPSASHPAPAPAPAPVKGS